MRQFLHQSKALPIAWAQPHHKRGSATRGALAEQKTRLVYSAVVLLCQREITVSLNFATHCTNRTIVTYLLRLLVLWTNAASKRTRPKFQWFYSAFGILFPVSSRNTLQTFMQITRVESFQLQSIDYCPAVFEAELPLVPWYNMVSVDCWSCDTEKRLLGSRRSVTKE